jgi:sulfur carrier protein ThiS
MGGEELTASADQTVRDALAELNFPNTDPVLPVVNGRLEDLDYFLRNGDRLELIPPISGGLCKRIRELDD